MKYVCEVCGEEFPTEESCTRHEKVCKSTENLIKIIHDLRHKLDHFTPLSPIHSQEGTFPISFWHSIDTTITTSPKKIQRKKKR